MDTGEREGSDEGRGNQRWKNVEVIIVKGCAALVRGTLEFRRARKKHKILITRAGRGDIIARLVY